MSVADERIQSRTPMPEPVDDTCQVDGITGLLPFPDANRLVVIGNGYCVDDNGGGGGPIIGPIFRRRTLSIAPGYYGGRQFLQVNMFDSSTMELLSTEEMEGSFVSARSIGDYAYIVTSRPVPSDLIKGKLNPWRSDIYRDGSSTSPLPTRAVYVEKAVQEAEKSIGELVGEVTQAVDCKAFSKVALFQNADSFDSLPYVRVIESISTVSGFNVNSPSSITSKSLILPSSYWQTYASGTHLVLAAEGWQVDNDTTEETFVIAYRLEDGAATTRALGSVPGYVLNQFSISHMLKNGIDYLLLATSNRDRWGWVVDDISGERNFERTDASTSQLTVLEIPQGVATDSSMRKVASLEGLGKPGEMIYSVRFQGDRAFVVTFEQIDPFYTIDLRDPENPVVAGELEIPGFSNYLHPIGDDYVLGVGQNVVDGRQSGLQISIFDVSDLNNPLRVQNYVEDNSGSSEAQYNHQAFRYLPESSILIIPLSIYGQRSISMDADSFDGFKVFSVDPEAGVEEYFSVNHEYKPEEGVCYANYGYLPPRSFVFTGSMWTMKQQTIRISDLSTRTTKDAAVDVRAGSPTVECPELNDDLLFPWTDLPPLQPPPLPQPLDALTPPPIP